MHNYTKYGLITDNSSNMHMHKVTAIFAYVNEHRNSVGHYSHHHHDAKRSAIASRRCDLPPERSVPSQLESWGDITVRKTNR